MENNNKRYYYSYFKQIHPPIFPLRTASIASTPSTSRTQEIIQVTISLSQKVALLFSFSSEPMWITERDGAKGRDADGGNLGRIMARDVRGGEKVFSKTTTTTMGKDTEGG